MTDLDRRHMTRALELAGRSDARVLPNPRVGAVVARGRRVVGEGWHKKFGGAHAEVMAIRSAGAQACRGATLYVTLEPCSHQGQTPPCTDAIRRAGFRRIVYASSDPNPRVSGGRLLRSEGFEVCGGVMAHQAKRLNPGFFKYQTTGRPHLHMKLASSLDGYMCLPDGSSHWITGSASRRAGHVLRGQAAAVLTGIGTVLADDPRMTVRHGPRRRPTRVVLDSRARLSPKAALFGEPGAIDVLVTDKAPVRRCRALERAGAQVHHVASNRRGQIDLDQALQLCGSLGLTEILVEAGPLLSGALLKGAWVDEVSWFQAPLIMGAGKSPGPLGVKDLGQALRLNQVTRTAFGADICTHGFLR